mmetsp:Transcript_90716/g.270758  ORF Transcript_90716/g.270758 Transcript_90716/m.270758 type:complete len:247 (+) Transcript_90716:252-992(+)
MTTDGDVHRGWILAELHARGPAVCARNFVYDTLPAGIPQGDISSLHVRGCHNHVSRRGDVCRLASVHHKVPRREPPHHVGRAEVPDERGVVPRCAQDDVGIVCSTPHHMDPLGVPRDLVAHGQLTLQRGHQLGCLHIIHGDDLGETTHRDAAVIAPTDPIAGAELPVLRSVPRGVDTLRSKVPGYLEDGDLPLRVDRQQLPLVPRAPGPPPQIGGAVIEHVVLRAVLDAPLHVLWILAVVQVERVD